ncbi:MAG: hypothetical protein FJ125_00185 [Deltaproteobacteria bacterium]|nr:hypothetical protein [Deltaproteobacteria bacterium]
MLRRLLLQDVNLKATALVLSLILFIFVRGDRVSDVGVMVPVIYQLPDSMVLVSDPVKRLRVTLSGRESTLRSMLRSGFEPVQVDLTRFEGKVFYFDENLFELEPGVRLVSIQPSRMEVVLEQRARKEVPVAPNVVGTPDPAFRLVEVSVQPRKIVVEGAKSPVRKITEVKTIPVDVDGRWESTEIEVALSQPEEGLVFSDQQSRVRVQLRFEPRYTEREYAAVPVEVVNTGWRTGIRPQTIRVKLDAPVQLLPKLEASSLRVVADARELEAKPPGSQHRLELEVDNLPDGVKVLELRPNRVLVKLIQRLPAEVRSPEDGGVRLNRAEGPEE